MAQALHITILTDESSWMNAHDLALSRQLEAMGHRVRIVHRKEDVAAGDVALLLSCFEIVPREILAKNRNNIVVHASRLPKGKGWSPASWRILEGADSLDITLFEACAQCDAGDVYLRERLPLEGGELIADWQALLGEKIVEMALRYVREREHLSAKAQTGESSFYAKRTPRDSMLDPEKTLKEQFNLLRIADNEKYPAYFVLNGKKYILKIYHGDAQ